MIENLPGAGGITGTSALVKAAPDGNTIGVVSNNHAVNPSVFKKMPYDTINDITPISVVGETPFVLVVNPAKLPAKNAKELQAFLKAKPGAYNYASSGNGTIIHLAGEMFLDAADVKSSTFPTRASARWSRTSSAARSSSAWWRCRRPGHIKSGALRADRRDGQQRVASLPDVPTIAEQGFPDVDVAGWFAVVGPAKLPAARSSGSTPRSSPRSPRRR